MPCICHQIICKNVAEQELGLDRNSERMFLKVLNLIKLTYHVLKRSLNLHAAVFFSLF